jgi:hypothetical protein
MNEVFELPNLTQPMVEECIYNQTITLLHQNLMTSMTIKVEYAVNACIFNSPIALHLNIQLFNYLF